MLIFVLLMNTSINALLATSQSTFQHPFSLIANNVFIILKLCRTSYRAFCHRFEHAFLSEVLNWSEVWNFMPTDL